MRLDGIHHITAITGDAPGNVDFYARVLGLRLVKKTVNFDAPEVYHLYYGDELGHPGSIMTFFEFPDARLGQAGAGMIHRINWRVPTKASIDFWETRLLDENVRVDRNDDGLLFVDREGLGHGLTIDETADLSLRARTDEIPPQHALAGFDGVCAYTSEPQNSVDLLTETMRFEPVEGLRHRTRGETRSATYQYDIWPERGEQGAGTVHHIAWACADHEQEEWQRRAAEAGMNVTPIIDRTYFKSIYFREPSGVLFEIATKGPGFAVDEEPEQLGHELMLPEQHESLRADLERSLTPLTNPRTAG